MTQRKSCTVVSCTPIFATLGILTLVSALLCLWFLKITPRTASTKRQGPFASIVETLFRCSFDNAFTHEQSLDVVNISLHNLIGSNGLSFVGVETVRATTDLTVANRKALCVQFTRTQPDTSQSRLTYLIVPFAKRHLPSRPSTFKERDALFYRLRFEDFQKTPWRIEVVDEKFIGQNLNLLVTNYANDFFIFVNGSIEEKALAQSLFEYTNFRQL